MLHYISQVLNRTNQFWFYINLKQHIQYQNPKNKTQTQEKKEFEDQEKKCYKTFVITSTKNIWVKGESA